MKRHYCFKAAISNFTATSDSAVPSYFQFDKLFHLLGASLLKGSIVRDSPKSKFQIFYCRFSNSIGYSDRQQCYIDTVKIVVNCRTRVIITAFPESTLLDLPKYIGLRALPSPTHHNYRNPVPIHFRNDLSEVSEKSENDVPKKFNAAKRKLAWSAERKLRGFCKFIVILSVCYCR